jgi:hypothetical protein
MNQHDVATPGGLHTSAELAHYLEQVLAGKRVEAPARFVWVAKLPTDNVPAEDAPTS